MSVHKTGKTPAEINLDKETIKGIASGRKDRLATIGPEFGLSRDLPTLCWNGGARMAKIGIVRDERYLLHDMGYHPESPDRLRVIYESLGEKEMKGLFVEVPPRAATREEIETVHDASYIDRVAETAGKPHVRLDPDTSTCPESYEAAIWAVGGLLEAIDAVVGGEMDGTFALVRPPGHHAEKASAMGFCLFNNIAIGARHAQRRHGFDRILIVDWDLHHGNGTQNAFYDEKEVLYFSTHQYPFYPGTGTTNEIGQGAGEGYTVNVPLNTGCGDSEYANIFSRVLKPITLTYQPQLILVSAGFDIHYRDPLGSMRVTANGFARLMNILKDIAQSTCSGRIVATLEGGYDLTALRESVRSVLLEMKADDGWVDLQKCLDQENKDYKTIERGIEKIQEIQGRYWNCF
jgi:acetoin utilization deacetylase AcuC-like enzyme